jgi:peptide/nickel transport system substrate-binding protein
VLGVSPHAALIGLLTMFPAATFMACERPTRDPASQGSTITLLYQGDERILGPGHDEEPKFLVFLPLAKLDANGEMEGRLARSWEHSRDYRTWTFHLRTDVRWHDGVPATAHDVKFTLDLLSHENIGYYPPGSVSARAVDDSTVMVTYQELPALDVRTDLTWTVFYPRHLLEGLNPAECLEWDFWMHPVGNGPYRYVRHAPQTMLELEANPDYYDGAPAIQRVIIRFGAPNLTELISGNVDVIPYVDAVDALAVSDDARFLTYHQINPVINRAIFWYQMDPLFRDSRVRRALTLAIDRSELLRTMNLPEDVPITDAPYTTQQFRRAELPEPLPYDPREAGRLLDDVGWRDSDGDGIREREGEEFRFRVLMPGVPDWERMGVFIQQSLRRVGVGMELLPLDPAAAAARVTRGDLSASIFMFTRTPERLQMYFGPSSIIGYHNPEVYPLLEQAAVAVSPDEEDRIFRQLAKILREDLPVTFLVPRVLTVVAHRRVRGLSSPFRAFAARHMEDLWIEDIAR